MGKPYADDLRLLVVRLIEEGHTRPEVATRKIVGGESVEHDAQRKGLVAQRAGRRREHTFARCAAPELDDFNLLAPHAFASNRGTPAVRAALGTLLGMRNES
jgi:hypothetical protein